MKQKLMATMIAFVLPLSAVQAAAIPQPSALDGRIQTAEYSPDNVFHIRAQVGRAVLVQLEHDEKLEGEQAALGMGDAQAWNLSVKGNNILFKPTAKAPTTNMLIVTNKRTYALQLSLVGGKVCVKTTQRNNKTICTKKVYQKPTYILRFTYPDTAQKLAQQQHRKMSEALALMRVNGSSANKVNHQYWGKGDKDIAPTSAYDDGRFTYFVFDNAKELPTIYKVSADGSEALVNSHVDGNAVVVHETAKNFVLRLGDAVLGIENRAFDADGKFNKSGTSTSNSVRLIKRGQ